MDMLKFQEELATKYGYKKLDPKLSAEVRQTYIDNLPKGLKLEGEHRQTLYTKEGTVIAYGYNRIVVGDYGAFIEYEMYQTNNSFYKITKGQEYRIDNPYYRDRVKYWWLTIRDNSNIKVYYQQRTVSYADYKPKKFYVSPHEVAVSTEELAVDIDNTIETKLQNTTFRTKFIAMMKKLFN